MTATGKNTATLRRSAGQLGPSWKAPNNSSHALVVVTVCQRRRSPYVLRLSLAGGVATDPRRHNFFVQRAADRGRARGTCELCRHFLLVKSTCCTDFLKPIARSISTTAAAKNRLQRRFFCVSSPLAAAFPAAPCSPAAHRRRRRAVRFRRSRRAHTPTPLRLRLCRRARRWACRR